MKRRLVEFSVIVALLLVLPGNRQNVVSTAFATDDDIILPCDPPPTHLCEARGGTFNYETCQCEFPPG